MIMLQTYFKPRHINFWIAVVVLIGAVLRSIQFFGATSLWFDELTSALNIQSRSFSQLAAQQLDYNQVAPVGFLYLEKISALIFGENDLAYRFFPWLLSLISLPLFVQISKKFLSGPYLLGSLILFSGSYATFIYSGQAKQYSGDLTACLLLVWITLFLFDKKPNKWVIFFFAITGGISILSCFQAVPLSLFLIAFLVVNILRSKVLNEHKYILAIAFVWSLAALLNYYYSQIAIGNTVKSAMSDYWANSNNGFPPSGNIQKYVLWFPQKLLEELTFFNGWWYGGQIKPISLLSWVLLLISIPGIIYLIKKNSIKTIILFSPLIIALVLAGFRIMPFANRVSLYASFPLLISGLAGLQVIKDWKPKVILNPIIAIFVLLISSIPLYYLVKSKPPMLAQPTQPVLKELKEQMKQNDVLFVYHKARHAIRFYGPKEGITNYQIANSHDDITSYLREIDKLKGNKRVWFFYTQWTETQPFPDSIKQYMGNVIGKEIGQIKDPYGGTEDFEAAAYLYDLSDPKE